MDGSKELWSMERTVRSSYSHLSSETGLELASPSAWVATALEWLGASEMQWLHKPFPPMAVLARRDQRR